MKSKEELKLLKENIESVSKKLLELSDEELTEVAGGCGADILDSRPTVSGIVEKLLEVVRDVKNKKGQS